MDIKISLSTLKPTFLSLWSKYNERPILLNAEYSVKIFGGQSRRPISENLWLRPTFSRLLVPTLICHKQMELRLPIGENLLHPMAQLLNNRTDTFYPLSDHSVFFTMLASFTEAWGSLLGSLDKNRPSSYF